MQATNLIQLAMSLVIDLKLDKSPNSLAVNPRTLLGDAWYKLSRSRPIPCVNRTPEDSRAVLGFYYLTSLYVFCHDSKWYCTLTRCSISTLFRRGQKLEWSNYLGECCEELVQRREFETDLLLVALVRAQRIADRAYVMTSDIDLGDGGTSVFRSPLDMALNGVHRELENFQLVQPEVVKQNRE